MLKLDDGRKELYQWDVGVTATVLDNQITQVHFSNLSYGISYDVEVEDGKVLIPPEVLQSGADVYCWTYIKDLDKGYTKKEEIFNVIKRPKPSGYAYTPTDIKTWDELNEKIENIVVDSDNIKNGSITLDKVQKDFFIKGIEGGLSDDAFTQVTQLPGQNTTQITTSIFKVYEITEESGEKIPTAEAVYKLVNGISGGMATITKETYVNELPSGIYRCKTEDNGTLYFDTNTEYGLVDGFAIITHLEGGKYQWFAIGVGYPDWEECARLGVSVVDAEGNIGVESVKDLNTIVTAEEIRKNIGEPVTEHITTLYGEVGKKENVSNKTNKIDRNSTDEQYASAKAVYQYSELIWQAHQIDVKEKLEDLKNKIGGEWKLITDITIPEENASVTLFVDKDSEGNPFSCTEIDIVWEGIKVTDDTTSGKAWISLNPTRAGYNTGKYGMATQNYFYYISNANYINGHSIRLSRGNLTQTGQNRFNTDFLKDFPNEITSIEVSGYQQKSFYGRVIIYGR